MIKFNNKENKLIEKEYPRLYGYVKDFILRHKQELPKILKVRIYDYENNYNTTGLSHYRRPGTGLPYDFQLDINLKQIFKLYKENNFTEKGRFYPGKIKGIRKYILFVIYHEAGHYNLKHCNSYIANQNNPDIIAEDDCDKWAYNKLQQGQADFNFKIGAIISTPTLAGGYTIGAWEGAKND